MTIREYITDKFQSFGINVSEADLVDMLNDTDFNSSDEASGDALNVANIAITKYSLYLLCHPTSINESGFSMSWDPKGLEKFYSAMCIRYGLDNELPDRPTITMS